MFNCSNANLTHAEFPISSSLPLTPGSHSKFSKIKIQVSFKSHTASLLKLQKYLQRTNESGGDFYKTKTLKSTALDGSWRQKGTMWRGHDFFQSQREIGCPQGGKTEHFARLHSRALLLVGRMHNVPRRLRTGGRGPSSARRTEFTNGQHEGRIIVPSVGPTVKKNNARRLALGNKTHTHNSQRLLAGRYQTRRAAVQCVVGRCGRLWGAVHRGSLALRHGFRRQAPFCTHHVLVLLFVVGRVTRGEIHAEVTRGERTTVLIFLRLVLLLRGGQSRVR